MAIHSKAKGEELQDAQVKLERILFNSICVQEVRSHEKALYLLKQS